MNVIIILPHLRKMYYDHIFLCCKIFELVCTFGQKAGINIV